MNAAYKLKIFQQTIGYQFQNQQLLLQALTHRSHSVPNNERLEFLGDSALNCAVAFLLYERFSTQSEGDLSRLRANLVKQDTLHQLAQKISLSGLLRLGEGELKSGGSSRPSILADAFEAIVGAILIEAGFPAVFEFIKKFYLPLLDEAAPLSLGKDAKTRLQEWLQAKHMALPSYRIINTKGAAHNQEFEVECILAKFNVRSIGLGSSRRAAEQSAAQAALDLLIKNNQIN